MTRPTTLDEARRLAMVDTIATPAEYGRASVAVLLAILDTLTAQSAKPAAPEPLKADNARRRVA